MSPRQAAQQTSLSRTLIYREIERGQLCAYKVGGRLRITTQALEDWKRRHSVSPRQAPAYEPGRAVRPAQLGEEFASELRSIRAERAA
jgi:excisionase family DNA binding protein